MDSNTHSTSRRDRLRALVAELQGLAAQDPDRLSDATLAERVRVLRQLAERLEGHWLGELAVLDARGAAGADQGVQVGSTAAWLRHRLRMSPSTAAGFVRTARALFRGPLTQTGQALADGRHLPGPCPGAGPRHPGSARPSGGRGRTGACWRRPGGWTHRGCGGSSVICAWWPTPRAPRTQANHRYQRRGLWLASTWEGMVAVNGLLDPEAGQTLLAALDPLARPASADDTRTGGQRRADALAELARRHLEDGQLPQSGGVRPQLLVTVDLDSLLGHPGGLGGETGGPWPLDPETCRRLACDAAVTRVLVTRHRTHHHDDPDGEASLAGWLQTAATRLPPTLGGAPTQPLEVGRTSRVVTARPTRRPDGPRRRLCGGRLRPAPGLVRSPPSAPLAAWRPHRPGQPGPVVPGPPSRGPRGRLASWPATRTAG